MNNTVLSVPLLSVVLCAQPGGRWSPSITSVSCELVVCEKPPPLFHGVTEGDSYNYGDLIMYSCLPGFSMKVLLIRSSFSLMALAARCGK